jgi:DNA-binding transcriptional regulator YdaS (Cro superfamily)
MDDTLKERASLALKLAINKAGGQHALARMLGISQPAISKWSVCPLQRVATVSALTGVPREELRPDAFGGDDHA